MSVDPGTATVLACTDPRNDEVAQGIHGNRRLVLAIGRIVVDFEFTSDATSRSTISLTVNPKIAAIRKATPRHNKLPGSIDRDRRIILGARRGRVDSEFVPLSNGAGVESLRVNARPVTVLLLVQAMIKLPVEFIAMAGNIWSFVV